MEKKLLEDINKLVTKRTKEIESIGINTYEQLKLEEREHSKIIFELLNPKGRHGQKTTFLKLFFEHVVSDNNDIVFCDDDNWIVKREDSDIDITITNPDKKIFIIVENKSNEAEDKSHQL